MNIAVRYFSKSGNTKLVAEEIAKVAGVNAISVDDENAIINELVDILFIGGALYAYGLDKHLKNYLRSLDRMNIKKAIAFSISWISKHSIDLIKKELKAKGIEIEEEYIYAKNTPSEEKLKEIHETAKKFLK